MTLHKHAHTGLVTPQLPQPLLTAVLRVIAMLVSSVRSTLQMITRRPPVNATQTMPAGLPRETSDTNQEPKAVLHDSPLTPVSHTHSVSVHPVYASPAKAGVQSQTQSARSASTPFAPSLDPGLRRGCVLREHANKP
jgi:hypothetical protein